jgi:hypothetical protein
MLKVRPAPVSPRHSGGPQPGPACGLLLLLLLSGLLVLNITQADLQPTAGVRFTHYLQIDWSQLKKTHAADIVVFNSNFFLHETDFIHPFVCQSWIIEGLELTGLSAN